MILNIWLFFGILLLGALVGSIVTNWINRIALDLGQKKLMQDGEMFVKKDGKWYPHSPYKPKH